MEIEAYTVAQLAERLRSDKFWCAEGAPITKHRALSHVRNPRARAEDLALLVAYDNGKVVGYLGVLPDLVFLNEEKRRIGWLTAWWADPNPKYAGTGLTLMVKAFRAYGGEVGASGFSDDAKKVYEASKMFLKVEETARIKALLRVSTRDLLPRKFPRLKSAKPLLGLLDQLLNVFCDFRLRLWRRRIGTGTQLRLEYVAEVDSETSDFIQKLQGRELTRRGAAEIEWIAKYPWVLSTPLGQRSSDGFYFSATARESACFMVKVFDSDNLLICFIMLRLIDGHLTVPFCYMLQQHADHAFRVIADHAVVLRAHSLTISRGELRQSLTQTKFPCVARINRSTRWVLGNAFDATINGKFGLQDGDGDCAFWS